MAEFLKDSQVITAIEDLIDRADDYLWLISPYIKLHQRIKDRLRLKKNNPNLEVVILFGKNEDDASKSLNKEDFDFLKDFPNIVIGYEKRLHAKYYASEDFSIITSMNLHTFSQDNNIEVAIKLKSKKWLLDSSDRSDNDAFNYFSEVVENCTIIYERKPKFKNGLLKETYLNSEIIEDNTETFFKQKEIVGRKFYQIKQQDITEIKKQGFCIRTGKPIPFNPKSPLSDEAYRSWARYKDENFKEKYCHFSGEPSYGETTYARPIMRKNWVKATQRV